MIGNVDLFSFIVPLDDETSPAEDRGHIKWEIAYDLDPNYWGKGLGKGMIGFLVNWAGWLGVDVVTAVSHLCGLVLVYQLLIKQRVATANSASQGVLRTNGFAIRYTKLANMPEDKGGYESEFGEWAKTL